MGASRQEYWSGLLCHPPGDLPNPGIEPRSPTLQADSLPAKPQEKPSLYIIYIYLLLLSHEVVSASCNPVACSPPGSSVHGISQARILGWVPIPSAGDLPDPGIEPASPALAGRFFTTEPPGRPKFIFRLREFCAYLNCA